MKINIYVAGLFHYRFYIKHIQSLDVFNKIIYSHKIKSLQSTPSDKKNNLPFKEYLMHLHIYMLGAKSAFRYMHIYNYIWDLSSSLFSSVADVNVILLQGNSIQLMNKIKRKNKIVIGDAVNVHPRTMIKIMDDEKKAHGVDFFWSKSIFNNKLKELEFVDYLITPSEFVASTYIENGFKKENIIVLPYGVDDFSCFSVGCKDDYNKGGQINVVCVGQVFPRKGQFHLLKAVSEYNGDYTFHIKLIGIKDNEYFDVLMNHGFDFEYVNTMNHSDVLKEIADSDVLVLNSIEDGFGMVVTEAMSVGTPVVVSKYAGSSEYVRKYGGGLVSDPYDYIGTVRSIIDCFNGDYKKRTDDNLPGWDNYANTLIKEILYKIDKI